MPCPAAPGASPPPYPSSVPSHSSFSARELQKERRSSVRPRCPPARGQRRAPAEPCRVGKGTGAGGSPVGQDRGAAQALAPAVLPEQLLLPLPSGDQKGSRACRTCKCPPHPSLSACCQLPARALHGGQRPFPARPPGRAWEPLLPGRGTGPHDSPKSGNAGARGPAEDEGGTVLSAASFLLLLLFLPRCLLPAAQHPQPVQGQAELWAQAVAPSAEKRGRQGAGGGLLGVPAGRALSPACRWEGGWCMEQQGGGAWGWRQGVPVLVPGPGPGLGERQLGCEGLTATWRRPVPPGGGEGASRSSCGPGSAARPRSAPARRR